MGNVLIQATCIRYVCLVWFAFVKNNLLTLVAHKKSRLREAALRSYLTKTHTMEIKINDNCPGISPFGVLCRNKASYVVSSISLVFKPNFSGQFFSLAFCTDDFLNFGNYIAASKVAQSRTLSEMLLISQNIPGSCLLITARNATQANLTS